MKLLLALVVLASEAMTCEIQKDASLTLNANWGRWKTSEITG